MGSTLASEAEVKLNVSSSGSNSATEPTATSSSSSAAPTPDTTAASSSKKKKKDPHRKDPRSQPPLTQLSRALSYLLRHGAEKEKLPIRADGFVPLSALLKHSRVKQIDMQPDNGAFTKDGKKKRTMPGAEDVRRCVEDVKEGEKRRFEMREEEGEGGGEKVWLVRAIQGHTLQAVVDLDHVSVTLDNLEVLALKTSGSGSDSNGDAAAAPAAGSGAAILPPGVEILHGTTPDAWDLIQSSGGLNRMKRNHIHLARARPGVEGVGSGMRPTSPLLIHIDLIAALRDGVKFHLASNGALLTAGVDEKGTLPLKYVSKVEDRKGEVVWQREE